MAALKLDCPKPKNIKIYDANEYEKLLKGIKVAACMITESNQIVDEASVIRRVNALTLNGPRPGEQCSCCGAGPFHSRAQQTAHYKHHWHTHNLKRRLFGRPPLSLTEYNIRQEDDSSMSASDSEDDNPNRPASDLFAAATRHCKAFFTNQTGQVFCIYRCILHHRKEGLSSDGEGHAWVDRCRRLCLPGWQRWAVIMVSGGHFAGAVFAGGTPVLHKTLHAYVTRRGQGQAQITRDQHGPAPRSAGASLRRYNQMQFAQHVQDILNAWATDLDGCSLILYRAVSAVNKGMFFGKNSPLKQDDLRLRMLPFPTKKPTFKEILRIHETVCNVDVYESMEVFQKALVASTAKPGKNASAETKRKSKGSPSKVDRARSREPKVQRELPVQVESSEDDGPCFIDSETPQDWIKTLSEQKNGITNSRKDLLIDRASSESTEDEGKENLDKRKPVESKRVGKPARAAKPVKKTTPKVSACVKKIWQAIKSESTSLDTIFECWESEITLVEACNTADPTDGNTALHKAAIADKSHMVTELLTLGSDPCIRNRLLQTPYAAAPSSLAAQARLAFRFFQAENPEKYDYAKSQIPGPLTAEQLAEERERRAQQKRAKRQRDKEKHAEKVKCNSFLKLNDQQKIRAPGDFRCFMCGVHLSKKPFEYEEYKFCSIKCLQNHRNLRPLNKS